LTVVAIQDPAGEDASHLGRQCLATRSKTGTFRRTGLAGPTGRTGSQVLLALRLLAERVAAGQAEAEHAKTDTGHGTHGLALVPGFTDQRG
jgi:hypothetical protein